MTTRKTARKAATPGPWTRAMLALADRIEAERPAPLRGWRKVVAEREEEQRPRRRTNR